MNARCLVPLLVLLSCRTTLTVPDAPAASCPEPMVAPTRNDPTEVVRAYFKATASGDLDAAAALVREQSSVFESGGNEGTWAHYREHHLGPEVDQIATFEVTLGELSTSSSDDGSLAVVTVPVEYDITLKDKREFSSVGTVTFALRAETEQYAIEHVHWSSRRKRSEAAPDPMALELAAYDKAKPVFETHCASCHRKGEPGATKKALTHFEMTAYPLGGHHADEIDASIGKALGIGGGKATMPKGKAAGSVTGEDLAAIAAWADAFAAAKAAGKHGAQSSADGHPAGHKH